MDCWLISSVILQCRYQNKIFEVKVCFDDHNLLETDTDSYVYPLHR